MLTLGTYLALGLAKQISLKRLINRLKQVDMLSWIEMGSPQPAYFSRVRDYRTSSPNPFAAPTESTDLSMWIKRRAYERLSDTELATNARRYRLFGNIQSAIAVGIVAAYVAHRLVT
jgi:hypothetical protein